MAELPNGIDRFYKYIYYTSRDESRYVYGRNSCGYVHKCLKISQKTYLSRAFKIFTPTRWDEVIKLLRII